MNTTMKRLEYERVSDDYFIYHGDVEDFIKVEGVPVELPGCEGMDLFVHQSIEGYGYTVTEGKSGARCGVYHTETAEEALLETERCMERYLSRESFDSRIERKIAKQGLSPRYKASA